MVSDRAATADTVLDANVSPTPTSWCCVTDRRCTRARCGARNAFGDAINAAATLVAIGAVASVLGEVMIDPRGGAPTTGLGYRGGAALSVPASEEQMARTRSLLRDVALVVIGPSGVVHHDGERWRVVAGDVVVTRGHDVVEL